VDCHGVAGATCLQHGVAAVAVICEPCVLYPRPVATHGPQFAFLRNTHRYLYQHTAYHPGSGGLTAFCLVSRQVRKCTHGVKTDAPSRI
jgi:hypothetical protein